MSEPEEILRGTILGTHLVEHEGHYLARPGYRVQLENGRVVDAIVRLTSLAKSAGRTSPQVGDIVEVVLGLVTEPIRIVAILRRR